MSKWSTQRPSMVDKDTFDNNWDAIFNKEGCPVCGCNEYHVYSQEYMNMEVDYKCCQECGEHYDIG